jgi:hypothetical protein
MTVPRKAPRKQAGTTEPPRPVPCIFSIYLYDAEPPANEPDARALTPVPWPHPAAGTALPCPSCGRASEVSR